VVGLSERHLSIFGAVSGKSSWSTMLTDLRLRWEWDPIRNDPRFQNILAGPEPKTVY
jgi:hypothetical protein